MESDTTYSFRLKDSLLGAQMLFVAFGALVLVLNRHILRRA